SGRTSPNSVLNMLRSPEGASRSTQRGPAIDEWLLNRASFFHLSLRERSTAEGRRVRVYGLTGWFPKPSPGASLRPLPQGEVRGNAAGGSGLLLNYGQTLGMMGDGALHDCCSVSHEDPPRD